MTGTTDRPCRRCHRPAGLHCPGCNTCDPDYTCPPTCDADPEEVSAAAGAVEQWEEAQARKARPMTNHATTPAPGATQTRYTTADLSKIADHLITVMADDPHVTDTQLDAAVHHLYGSEVTS